jgi:hypothetical protein
MSKSSIGHLGSTRSPFSLSGSLALSGNKSLKGGGGGGGLGSTGRSSGQVPPSGLVYQKGWNEATATITID